MTGTQTNLIDALEAPNSEQPWPKPPGLSLLGDFVSPSEEHGLVSIIDEIPWSTELKRRVQHYGYRYDYKARRVDETSYLGPLPEWLGTLCDRLVNQMIFDTKPDQVIINEYKPGQGISPHTDCIPCFGDTIASLSLKSSCKIKFAKTLLEHHSSDTDDIELVLEPRSLLVMKGEARHHWKHSIPARQSDVIAGVRTPRSRRVSLTFRTITRTVKVK
ncbi:MAG: alpha-ketoglutarate-dependent dioxygenase AlkB [Pseudomonadota bacterium]